MAAMLMDDKVVVKGGGVKTHFTLGGTDIINGDGG
jgi:hypothetical protein